MILFPRNPPRVEGLSILKMFTRREKKKLRNHGLTRYENFARIKNKDRERKSGLLHDRAFISGIQRYLQKQYLTNIELTDSYLFKVSRCAMNYIFLFRRVNTHKKNRGPTSGFSASIVQAESV